MSSDPGSAATPRVRIDVANMAGGGWECDVEVNGESVGGGTASTLAGALDVAMDILYGDKNDWLNGNEGQIARLKEAS